MRTQPIPMAGFRIFLCLSGAITAIGLVMPSVYDDASSPHAYGGSNWAAFMALSVVCLWGLADTVINDVLSDRWCSCALQNHRTDIYVLLAALNLMLVYIVVAHHVESWGLARFVLDAFGAAYVASRDVQLRYVKPRKERQAHAAQTLQGTSKSR